MKILSWNINGLKSIYNKNVLSKLLKDDYDIICFQEVKLADESFIREVVPNNYFIYYNLSENKGKHGVAIISKIKASKEDYLIGHSLADKEGRYIKLEFDNYMLINLYVPHGGRQKENLEYKLEVINKLINNLKSYKNKNIIITTDFNIARSDIDVCRAKQNYKNIMFTEVERNTLENLLNIGFIDSYRYFNPDTIKYSWWPYAFNCREKNVGWRIDYILISNGLLNKVKNIDINENYLGSDHAPLIMEMESI